MSPGSSPRAHALLRWLGRLLLGVSWLVVFVVAAAAGLLLHLDLPAPRRLAARALTRVLSDFFYGRLEIGAIDVLRQDAVRARDVIVIDPLGKQVLSVSELRVKADLPQLAGQLLWGESKETLILRHIRLEDAECELIPDAESSAPTLVRALTPVPTPRRRKPPETERYIRVWMPVVEIGRAWGRGVVGDLPMLEAQVQGAHGSVLASPKGAAIDVKRFGALVRGFGGADARGTGDLHIRVPGPVWTSLNGNFGDIEISAFIRVDGSRVTTQIELPKAQPEAVRALWPEWPLHDALVARVQAQGELSALATEANFELGQARISARGQLRLTRHVGANLDVQARDVDLRALFPEAPPLRLSSDARVFLWRRESEWVVDIDGATQPTAVAGWDVPAVDVRGTYARGKFTGRGKLHEPGLPVQVDFAVASSGTVEFEATAPRFRVQGAPRLAGLTGGDASVVATVKGRVEQAQLDATVDANFQNLRARGVTLQRGKLNATVSGPVAEPLDWNVDAEVDLGNVAGGGFGFERVDAHARGSARSARVTADLEDTFGPNVKASGQVLLLDRRIQDLDLAISRSGVTIAGKVSHLDLERGHVEVRDLQVTGAGGTLSGTVRLRPNLLQVDARAEELDLAAVSRALGLPRGTLSGRLSFDADVTTSDEVSRGRVRMALGDATIVALGGISADVNLALSRDRFDGTATVAVAERGVLGATWETTLAGPALEEQSWRDIVGQAELYLGKVSLTGAEELFPADAHIQRIDGNAFAHIKLQRKRKEALPGVSVVLGTQDLRVVQGRTGEDGAGQPGLESKDIDVQVGATVDGETGDTRATVRLVDGHGLLAMTTATAQVDLEQLVAQSESFWSQLEATPLSAVLTLPARPLAELPEQLRPDGVTGTISGRMTLGGTLSDPIVSTTLRLEQFQFELSRDAHPVDLLLAAQYERRTGRFGGRGELLHEGRRVALLNARGTARWEDLVQTAPPSTPRWKGDAELLLQGLPLKVIPGLAEGHVSGTLHGTVALQRTGEYPELRASLEAKGTTVGGVPIGDGTWQIQSDRKRVSSRFNFAHQGRILSVTAGSPLRWVDGWPRLDERSPAVVELHAERFDAVVLQPLLRGALTKLTGEIDAKLRAELVQPAATERDDSGEWSGNIKGTARLTRGVVQIAGMGLTLDDVTLLATARPGRVGTIIEVSDVRARARSPKHNLQAAGTFYLDGLSFSHGNVALQTVEDEIPLLVQGVNLATAKGSASAYLQRKEDRILVEVDVAELRAKLPSSSERDLIEVKENENIEIAQPLTEPTEPSSESSLPWHFVLNLGKEVRVIRHDMYIPISGQPVIVLGEEAEVTGYVNLDAGGRIQTLGKVFEVKTGQLRFDTGDNGNPHLDVTAAWQAPEAIVYIELHGTLKHAELTLRSDPPRPEHEIIALLLGNTTDESEGAGEGSSSGAALGAASQASAEILDKLLADTPLSDIKFRASATEGKPSYTAAYRISDQVWLEGIYRPEGGAEQNSAGQGSDLSGQGRHDAFAGAIDYRFHQDWSLRTEGGNASAELGVLWQYRY